MESIYDGRRPILSLVDPDLIKTIFINEFYALFTNRQICPIISHYAENLEKNAIKKAKLNESADMKDIFGTYSVDVVTSTAFSVDVDSINNPNDLFITNIQKLIKFIFFNSVIILVLVFPAVIPILAKLNFSFFQRDVNTFFTNFLASVKAKRQKGVHTDRVDFLQLMVDSQVTNVSSEKQNGDSKSTDKGSSHIRWSDAVGIYGHLKPYKCSPLPPRIERVCKKDVQLNGITVPKGTVVMVPAYILHHDPKYWPEPEEFRPERCVSNDSNQTEEAANFQRW
ncbi:hypothetical protein chiPu_0008355 [Chiloscyllium punctatum]|uniref:Uncharacterized protein n=1 Tax=Chiloscyllium punctatum TaxID=137246 RepID=A0A401SHN7_CHIPU|nr:hypothetical protein [Chiloscyllium punctatum]